MKTWLITDTHFGHDKMIEYCGRPKDFENLIFNNLDNISADDILIHLGDFCIGNDEHWHSIFDDITRECRKWLLRGNHDRKSNSWYMSHGWDWVGEKMSDIMFGKKIMYSHIPVVWDGFYEVNIHGHFHNSDHRLFKIKNGYQKLLALEYTNYKPVLLETFLKTKHLKT